MYTSLISLGVNVSLIITLIPIYGLNGAAMAASISLVSACIFGVAMLYYYFNLQPFRREHFKSTIAISIPFVVLAYTFNLIPSAYQTWFLPIFIFLVYAASLISLFFFGCFDDNEMDIFESFMNRFPIRLHEHMLKLSKVRAKL
jgi:O-antigen/teichoic acid export membrane protein